MDTAVDHARGGQCWKAVQPVMVRRVLVSVYKLVLVLDQKPTVNRTLYELE